MNFPEGFLAHISDTEGFDIMAFEQAHLLAAPTSIRFHPAKVHPAFSESSTVPWCNEALYLKVRPDFTLDPHFHAGGYYVQEASSMSVVHAFNQEFDAQKDIRVLDLCAAPGGKSTHILSWLNGSGLLVSNEVIRHRASVLRDNLSKWGYANVLASNNDPKQLGSLHHFFNALVIDAPCSGSGMFRKDPGAMKHWSTEAVKHCAERQKRILCDVWDALQPGGLCVYSTCSYSTAENEAISNFICTELGADYVSIKALDENPGIVCSDWGYRFWPHRIQGEGFFMAVLRKHHDSIQPLSPSKKSLEFKKVQSGYASWVNEDVNEASCHLGSILAPIAQQEALNTLYAKLHTVKIGIQSGEIKNGKFIPHHELALYNRLSPEVPRISLDREHALRYLKKESLRVNHEFQGQHLLCFENSVLGWGNAVGNRINNGLPKSWRILKEIDFE
jgi:16S rRNA C967 or C1407 C5-methylase (RsmB/RsmF family)/NOL1/NOP2/fmu family ribosome biogenesis protein